MDRCSTHVKDATHLSLKVVHVEDIKEKQVVDRCFLPKEMFLDHYEVLLTFSVNQIPFLKLTFSHLKIDHSKISQKDVSSSNH